jgi:protein SCO1/2
MHKVIRTLSIIMLVLLLLAPARAVQEQKKPEKSAAPQSAQKPEDPDAKKREYFTDLELITHEGKKVRFYTDMLKDKVVLVTAYYLSCARACPMQNVVLNKLQKILGDRFGKSIFFLSISVDPANDKWELVKDYAKVWDAKSGWTFLTGKKVNVDWVAYKMGLYVEDPQFHETRYILGNVKTARWVRMPPQSTAEELALRLQDLEKENLKP